MRLSSLITKLTLALSLGLSFTSIVAAQNDAGTSPTKRPNIVIMMTDDQGYGDIGAHGNPYLETPHMEAIGERGLEMTHFFSYPNCSATRAALLTGRYPYRTGVTAVTQVDHFMNASEITFAELLAENGYKTGIFGKWHVGDNFPMRPTNQGFQEALVHKGGGVGQAAGPAGNTYFDPILEHNDTSKRFDGYVDDIFTDAALDFIDDNQDEPFLLYLATNLPHFPLQVPDWRAQRFRDMGLHEANSLTYGMIENIDDNVGRVVAKLETLGLENDTLVIFLSDNGARDRRTKNDVYPGRWVANLRGTKTSVYDGGIRVPFYVQWPGVIAPEQTSSTMGSVIDILPTVLDITGIEAPEGVKIDGQSLMPLWTMNRTEGYEGRAFIAQMHYGPTPFKYMHFTVRTETYKLVSPHDFPHGILYQPTDDELEHVLARLELYNMKEDPSERIDLSDQQPEIVEELLAIYENWFDEVTEERDAKGIQRIYLGHPEAPAVNLSRFDWGGPRVLSQDRDRLSHNKLGHWRVKSFAGKYDISLDLPEIAREGVAHIKFKDLHLRAPVKPGQKRLTFKSVPLPDDEGNFHAYVKVDRLSEGPHFVDVVRVAP